MIESTKDKYLKLYKLKKKENEDLVYTKKKYPLRTTQKDRDIERSRFSYRGFEFKGKHLLIIILMFFMIIFLCETALLSTADTKYTLIGYIFLFTMLLIAFKYDVNSKFYIIFVILFIIHFSLTKSYNIIFPRDIEFLNNKNNKIKK